MEKVFSIENYTDKQKSLGLRNDENLERIVKMGVDLTEAYVAKNFAEMAKASHFDLKSTNDDEYSILNKAFELELFRYVFSNPTLELTSETRKSFRRRNPLKVGESERYYDVISAVLTTVTPAVTTLFTGLYSEVRNIGYGDTAEFDVESNEIFQVNVSAEGVAYGGEQAKHRYTKTVNTKELNITFSTDWYRVAAGKEDFGKNFFRAAQGFASYFTVEAYNKLYAMAQQIPAAYKFTGITTENIDLATMAVEGANGGAQATILGTLPALREALPANDFLKVGVGAEWVKMGYVGEHAGTPLVKIANLVNPVTVNTNTTAGKPAFMFYNNVLFVMPFVGANPIKVVFEGDLFNITRTAVETDDKTERASLTYKAGVDFVYSSVMALITAQ